VIDIAPVTGAEDLAAVRALFHEYAQSLESHLEYQDFSAEVASLPGAYSPPDGALLLARRGGSAAGCVAVRRLGEQLCEMKRLYVRPPHRGSGAGAQLVRSALESARDLGYHELWLDTLPTMGDAHKLYVRLGFREIAPYGSNFAPGSRFYGFRLVA
jgi:putative acetyltransferase